jgi:hypothetical protein
MLVGKRIKGEKWKMKKRYLPAIAALLIALTCASFLPVFGQLPTFVYSAPTLNVVTIAQDDQLRKTGVIVFTDTAADFQAGVFTHQDLMAQFKILVSYNGLQVNPTGLQCFVIEKDKYNPLKHPQGTWEDLVTIPKDMSNNFICKWRSGPPGVGVLDVYFTSGALAGTSYGFGAQTQLSQFIADYVLVVYAWYTVGRNTVYGTDIQDICVLGWPLLNNGDTGYMITKPDGTFHWVYADQLGPWVNCEDAALYEHAILGLPIPWY